MRVIALIVAAGLLAIVLSTFWFLGGEPKSAVSPQGGGMPRHPTSAPTEELSLGARRQAAELHGDAQREDSSSPSDPVDSTGRAQEPAAATSDALEPLVDDETYSQMSSIQLERKAKALQAEIDSRAGPIFDELTELGRFEVVGDIDNHRGVTSDDNDLILRLHYDGPTGQVRRIVIPESEYPSIYLLKEKQTRVLEELGRR